MDKTGPMEKAELAGFLPSCSQFHRPMHRSHAHARAHAQRPCLPEESTLPPAHWTLQPRISSGTGSRRPEKPQHQIAALNRAQFLQMTKHTQPRIQSFFTLFFSSSSSATEPFPTRCRHARKAVFIFTATNMLHLIFPPQEANLSQRTGSMGARPGLEHIPCTPRRNLYRKGRIRNAESFQLRGEIKHTAHHDSPCPHYSHPSAT